MPTAFAGRNVQTFTTIRGRKAQAEEEEPTPDEPEMEDPEAEEPSMDESVEEEEVRVELPKARECETGES